MEKARHLSLDFPANNGWTQCNGMQILAYFIGSSSPRRWRSSPGYCRRRPSPEMNGEPLNVLHGAPPRLRNELVLGFKQVKWIQAIELAESRPPRRPGPP